jgi:hypothetical protein
VLFVGRSQIVPSHDAAWKAIRADDFDPTVSVILEADAPPVDNQPVAKLALSGYASDRITVAVSTDQAGYLVLPDAYYPGWQATINGQLTAVYQANYAFRAVYVPAGEHTVEFTFRPAIWIVGLTISGLTLLLLLAWDCGGSIT